VLLNVTILLTFDLV